MTKTDVVLAAIRKGCKDRKLMCITTAEVADMTGMPVPSIAACLANLRRTGKVEAMTYADENNLPSCIGKGWTLTEFWQ